MKRLGVIVLIVLLVGSSSWAAGPKEGVGALLGAGTGALIGSTIGDGSGQVAAIVVGTLAGAMVGQNIGYELDRADQLAMQTNAQQTLEYSRTNQVSEWVNPDTGHAGSTTAMRTYQSNNGQYCREYQQTVIVAGEPQQAYGTACRQPDGSWQTVDPNQVREQVQAQQVVKEVRYVDPYYYSYRRPYYSPYPFFVNFSYFHGHNKYYGHKRYYRGHHKTHYRGHHKTHYRGHHKTHYRGHHKTHYRGHHKTHYRGHHKTHYRGHYKRHDRGHHFTRGNHGNKYRGNRWGSFGKRHRRH